MDSKGDLINGYRGLGEVIIIERENPSRKQNIAAGDGMADDKTIRAVGCLRKARRDRQRVDEGGAGYGRYNDSEADACVSPSCRCGARLCVQPSAAKACG